MSPARRDAIVAFQTSIDARQNLPLGVAAGCAGGIAGTLIWAAVTATTHYQIGFMALGVAFLVGFGMRRLGSGRTPLFGYVGGALALLGSMLGNFLTGYALFVAPDARSDSGLSRRARGARPPRVPRS